MSEVEKAQEVESCCYRAFHPLGKEFRKSNFGLAHEPVDDFYKSQWQSGRKSYWWLIYRWCLAACFSVGVLGSVVQQFSVGKWFIYLTNWGFTLCMLTSIFGAVLTSIHHCHPNKIATGSFITKLYWASHWSTLVLATLITFIYWIFIYPVDIASATAVYNLWAHGFNSILMILDHMLVAFPTRILHFIYPLIIGIIYFLFSLIYYCVGGLDIFGNHFIYEILDYEQPLLVLSTVVACIVLVALFSILLFLLYKLRYFVYRKCNKSVLQLNV